LLIHEYFGVDERIEFIKKDIPELERRRISIYNRRNLKVREGTVVPGALIAHGRGQVYYPLNRTGDNAVAKFNTQANSRHNILFDDTAAPGTTVDGQFRGRVAVTVKPTSENTKTAVWERLKGVTGITGADHQLIAALNLGFENHS